MLGTQLKHGVLLGSAMLAAVAAGAFSTLEEAQDAMSVDGHVVAPDETMATFYDERTRRHFELLTQSE